MSLRRHPPPAGRRSGAAAPLKGVSQAELDNAARPGNSKQQIKDREKVAKRFYKQHGGMDAREARNHMRGIDFNKPPHHRPPAAHSVAASVLPDPQRQPEPLRAGWVVCEKAGMTSREDVENIERRMREPGGGG